MLYYLGLGVRVSFRFHFAEGPEIHHVTQTNRTGHICPSTPVWRLGPCEMVGQFPLQTQWRGPFKILTTLTHARAAGREPWIHCSKVKRPLLKQPENKDWYKSGLCDLNGSSVPVICTVGNQGSDLAPKFACGFSPKALYKNNLSWWYWICENEVW